MVEGYSIKEILPGLFCIPVPLVGNPLKELNCYLFKRTSAEGSRNLIVDTGFKHKECYEAIVEGCAVCGADISETDILLTHIHGDHISNAPLLRKAGAKVYLSRPDAKYLVEQGGGRKFRDVLEDAIVRFAEHKVPEDKLNEMTSATFPTIVAKIEPGFEYNLIDDGERITAGGYTLKAICTPGHTPGHMCFQVENTGAMILGDHVLFDITPNITNWPGIEDSLGDYLNSLDMINAYDVTIPLPAHRHAGSFHDRISQLKEHHVRRIAECYSVVKKLEKAYLYDIAGNMTWKIRAANWEEFPPMQRWFAIGECISHLDYLAKRGDIEACRDLDGFIYYKARG